MVRPGAIVIVTVLLLAGSSEGARYKGERTDASSGEIRGRWIIRTTRPTGEDVLRTVVRCRPGRRCRPFPGRVRFDMAPGVGEYAWSGTFEVGGATCTLDAYVYDQGFESTYQCEDGGFGSISGRRVEAGAPAPYAAP